MHRAWGVVAGLVVSVGLGAGCDPTAPVADTLIVAGTLEREGVEASNENAVEVRYESEGARAEWWPCEMRMTASGCVGDHHVNVYVGLPQIQDLDGLGRNACVVDGEPFGAFELMQASARAGRDLTIPGEVSVFILVASDKDDDGSADLDLDEETTAASRLTSGNLEILALNGFDDPASVRITGTTSAGNDVDVAFQGATSAATLVPPLDVPTSCVDPG